MTKYIVHLYREMRLSYTDIEADTPESAAAIASSKPTDDADNIDDCEGQNLAALVDVAGDEDYSESVTIDFEPERQRKAASKLLTVLEKCAVLLADYDDDPGEEGETYRDAIAAIAEAEAGGIVSARPASRLLAALQAVLPYAENEAQSLHECWRRDGDLQIKDEYDRLERHIEQARTVIGKANASGIRSAGDAPVQPIVTVTVRGGLIEDLDATIPLNAVVEDWDIQDDETGRKPARNVWKLTGSLTGPKVKKLRRLIAND